MLKDFFLKLGEDTMKNLEFLRESVEAEDLSHKEKIHIDAYILGAVSVWIDEEVWQRIVREAIYKIKSDRS